MSFEQNLLSLILCLMSVLLFLFPIGYYIYKRLNKNALPSISKKIGANKVFIYSAIILLSIWFLRFSVGYYRTVVPGDGGAPLNGIEEFFNSFSHAFQTFSMDEDYKEYIIAGREMFEQIESLPGWFSFAYGVYASLLNFIAPVLGGAVLFELIANVFPQIRLRVANYNGSRDKFYFSELNQCSLELARNIYTEYQSDPNKENPVIIFTDTYVDSEKEISSELYDGAKAIGAICLSSDIAHIPKAEYGKKTYFLIDECEISNLNAYVDLASDENYDCLLGAKVFLFTHGDAYVQVNSNIRESLLSKIPESKQFRKEIKKVKDNSNNSEISSEKKAKIIKDLLPSFVPVNSDKNLVNYMLYKLPLFEALIGKKKTAYDPLTLTVTILGTGYIGKEMFLATYWYGQILNCRLVINVISQESKEEFWNKIDYISPEIKHSTEYRDPLLRVYKDRDDFSDPYCKVNYTQCDALASEFVDLLKEESAQNVLDTNYFFVALGSDELNISVANTIKRYVGTHHLAKVADDESVNNSTSSVDISSEQKNDRTVISYVVFNSELADKLNASKRHKSNFKDTDIYMAAVGSLREIYSLEYVFMNRIEDATKEIHRTYLMGIPNDQLKKDSDKRIEDEYSFLASRARTLHIKYKAFSADLFDMSVFDDESQTPGALQKSVCEALTKYKKLASGDINFNGAMTKQEFNSLLHSLAWLEHRRWNAYIRSQGFRCTNDYTSYGRAKDPSVEGDKGVYKQMELKLHPCLVECCRDGILGEFDESNMIISDSLFDAKYRDGGALCTSRDLLDDLSYHLYELGYNGYDFKQYDYPSDDLSAIEKIIANLSI